ncbi:MAG TPA: hypothetical protein VKW06_11695 [Candidatus Angelobacter sp.]|nr:hypothetical protein [Candidatus Angelobacter sp.]
MANKKADEQKALVKARHSKRPGWDYYLFKDDQREMDRLLAPFPFPPPCVKACTQVMTLLPKTNIQGQSGVGYFMINIDGFRYINAYVISDALNSSLQRGFSLELSFSVNPFVLGVGVVGESSFFFNFDSYYDPSTYKHGTIYCQTNDLTSLGGLPQIGGVDLTHIQRVPVLGPYVRASVFNEDVRAQNAQVVAYLST